MANNYLRRIVALGSSGTSNPQYSAQDVMHNLQWIIGCGARWVRITADLPALFPNAPSGNPLQALPDPGKIAELDRQIQMCNQSNPEVHVVLQMDKFPLWLNGLAGQPPTYAKEDRFASLADYQAWQAGVPGHDPKQLEYGTPSSGALGVSGGWGLIVQHLVHRYSEGNPNRVARISYLELMNEPNYQWWPQQTTLNGATWSSISSNVCSHCIAGQMFVTAQSITGWFGYKPFLLGPALADTTLGPPDNVQAAWDGATRTVTEFRQFSSLLMDWLNSYGFQAATVEGFRSFGWSHHSYHDVEQVFDPPPSYPAWRLRQLQQILKNKGWTGSPFPPECGIFVTEGGARVPTVGGEANQAARIQEHFARIYPYDLPGGGTSRVEMMAQYLLYPGPTFDSSFFHLGSVPGAIGIRPAYYTWQSLPIHP